MCGLICATASMLCAADGFCPSYTPDTCYGPVWTDWGLYSREKLPFYSLHPPVYYSLPVPRTYGYSPFAYPPGVRTPEVAPIEPEVIRNHTIPTKPAAQQTPARTAAAPLRLINPYVVRSDRRSESEPAAMASLGPVQPLVIFPAATAQSKR
jgi:hypothetical protein